MAVPAMQKQGTDLDAPEARLFQKAGLLPPSRTHWDILELLLR